MEESRREDACEPDKVLVYKNGKIHFRKTTERKLFFVMTLIMLLLGILVKLGLF